MQSDTNGNSPMMQLSRAAQVFLALMLAVSVSSAKKSQPVLEWKTGILWQSPDPCNYDEGVFDKGTFLIVADDIVYHVSQSAFAGRKPNVTDRSAVKYAMAQGYFYLQDEDGRVFKMAAMKKELDPTAQERLKSGRRPCQP